MATVTIRLDDQRHSELEQLARERDSTVSDMLRVAIDGLLRRDVHQSLDMVARRSLALSHEILAPRSRRRRSVPGPCSSSVASTTRTPGKVASPTSPST